MDGYEVLFFTRRAQLIKSISCDVVMDASVLIVEFGRIRRSNYEYSTRSYNIIMYLLIYFIVSYS